MRSWILSLGALFALAFAAPLFAEEAAEDAAAAEEAPAEQAAAQDAAAPEGAAAASDPAESEAAGSASAGSDPAGSDPAAETAATAPKGPIRLGPVGHDDQGRPGRIHTVAPGNTLWDVSDAYLGTPWVWPSIWRDNSDIQNPHLIHPGDKLWISPHEMRRLTDAEAAEMMGGGSPAALADGMESPNGPSQYRFSTIQTAGFVTRGTFDGNATIVDSVVDRVWLGDHDAVIIGLGAGETAVGDQYEIFRRAGSVSDPETGLKLGWATNVLGWLEVLEVHDETATAMIRLSSGEIRRGDHLLPRPRATADIDVAARPDIDGSIMHTPVHRFEMGSTDVVYLNRGAADGLQVGSPLEVYRPIGKEVDRVQNEAKQLPDWVIGKLIVVSTTPDTATAVITKTSVELQRGDRFRGADSLW